MIIVCVGNSHTAGIELWEENNIPNYCTMNQEDAWNSLYYADNIEDERKDLTYSGFIKELKPDWKVFNFAEPAAGQFQISMTIVNKFNDIKKAYPDDEIVVLSQDTYRSRFTYLSSRTNDYEGIPLNKVDAYLLKQNPDSAEVLRFTDKYITDEQMAFNFYFSCFGARSYIESLGATILNFNIYNHIAKYKNDTNENIVSLKNKYLNHLQVFPKGVTYRIKEIFGITRKDMTLPCWHLKHQYHEIIAKDFIDYIEGVL
jgi:hypothetical protein